MEIKMFTIFQFYFLGKDGISKSDEFLEKFQKGGGGGHFQSKNLCCRFFAIINASSLMYSRKKAQHDFPKMRGGGGSKAVWNFSKNSSLLETPPFPKNLKHGQPRLGESTLT